MKKLQFGGSLAHAIDFEEFFPSIGKPVRDNLCGKFEEFRSKRKLDYFRVNFNFCLQLMEFLLIWMHGYSK